MKTAPPSYPGSCQVPEADLHCLISNWRPRMIPTRNRVTFMPQPHEARSSGRKTPTSAILTL
jgi:hypothetical protein